MPLIDQVQTEMVAAMKSKDEARLSALRMFKAALMKAKVDSPKPMDDAAEFDQYSVDVTRTIPVSGKFTKEQADIYRLVWDAQQAGFAMAKPGHAASGGPDSIQGAASEVFKQGLFKLGLITDPKSDAQMRVWFNHGISHGIGLNVHDPGGRELQPGMANHRSKMLVGGYDHFVAALPQLASQSQERIHVTVTTDGDQECQHSYPLRIKLCN